MRAGRDHQPVVAEPSTVGRAHLAAIGVDGGERPAVADHAQLGQSVEWDARSRSPAERRQHRRRPLDVLAGGRQELDGDAAAGEGMQRQHGLEGGDAAAGDEDAERGNGHG